MFLLFLKIRIFDRAVHAVHSAWLSIFGSKRRTRILSPYTIYEWNSLVPSRHEVVRLFPEERALYHWSRRSRDRHMYIVCRNSIWRTRLCLPTILFRKWTLAVIVRRIKKFPRHALVVESEVEQTRVWRSGTAGNTRLWSPDKLTSAAADRYRRAVQNKSRSKRRRLTVTQDCVSHSKLCLQFCFSPKTSRTGKVS